MTKGQFRRLLLRLEPLLPFLVGDRPGEGGEWPMFCPLHGPEQNRSASLNVETEQWYCFGGCGGGELEDLLIRQDVWCDPPSAAMAMKNGGASARKGPEMVSDAHASGWHSALMSNDRRIDYLKERIISEAIMQQYEIGWDESKHVYTIPVRDFDGTLLNIRRYNPHPRPGRPKIRSITGMGSPRLYPLSALDEAREKGYVVVGEGEWDTLATLGHGFPAITRTASADTWRAEWSEHFRELTVFLAHDRDKKGQVANRKVARALSGIADVRVLELPYEIDEKRGKDLTDFWKEYTAADFERLMDSAPKWGEDEKVELKPERIAVVDAHAAAYVGLPKELSVTIKGRKDPGYSIPRKGRLECTQDAGTKCNACPLNGAGGDAEFAISPKSPIVLELIDVAKSTVNKVIATDYEIPGGKCSRLKIFVDETQAVETLFARPSLDTSDGSKAQDYKTIKVLNVGKHDTKANNTYSVVGALYPSPKTQSNEWLAWSIEQSETSIDHFELTPDVVELLQLFAAPNRPLKRLRHVADAMSQHVTHIVGRPELHMLMDLVFHSALAFEFAGRLETKGWLDALIIGDTRTGKSEVASSLVRHYGVGEIVGGETASIAGIIGGVQQIGNHWVITWGVLPQNDRRLVVIDELSGLSIEDIAALSLVRASGVAEITKVESDATPARTRLLSMSNPRNARMQDFTYGVDAIKPLVGNNEDIARFDLAMSVAQNEVPIELINMRREGGQLDYTAAACHALVLWAWTREPDHIVWRGNAEQRVFDTATAMGLRYDADPPLVQAANIRTKIQRTAVALAARTFSTDNSHQAVYVTERHVDDAVAFMDQLYRMGTFGYAERSEERIADRKFAERHRRHTRKFLADRPGLTKFLRDHSSFRRQDLEEMLDIEKSAANNIINSLYEWRMLRKEQANVKVEPTLHGILREGAQ